MPPIFDQVLPTNFGPLVTDKVIIDSDYYGGELSITELAESLQPDITKSNIASLFPQRDVEATMIRIQQFHKPTGTIFSFVERGMPDTFLSQSGNMLGEWIVQPFYMRASFYVSHGEINSKVKPGTTNTRWGAVEQIQEKVKEFMVAFGQEVQEYPNLPPEEVVDLRLDLINEEVGELCEAVERDDMTEIADALTDILYFTYGMGAALGIDLDKCFEEVQRSNMSKLGEDGKPMYREDGKLMKGPNYSPPDLTSVLNESL